MWATIGNWFLGFAAGIALDQFVAPVLKRHASLLATRRAQARCKQTKTPDPPPEFPIYRLGNIEIPVMNLVGTPDEPYCYSEVDISYNPVMFHQRDEYPEDLAAAVAFYEYQYDKRYGDRFTNNDLPRLSGYIEKGETGNDRRGNLLLELELTSFFNFNATNRSLDLAVIPGAGAVDRFRRNRTIREAYVSFPYDLRASVLANPMGSHLVLISRNIAQDPQEQVLIRYRSKDVVLYNDFYQAAAAGYVSTAHKDHLGRPNPFVTAVEEARQEIASRLALAPSDYRLIGLAATWQELDLNFYGYAETGLPAAELIGDHKRDSHEGWCLAIPFTPESVLSHIGKNRWEPIGALAMCATLLSKFRRDEVDAVARCIPAKTWRNFIEDRRGD